ncbi:MAG: TetR/AcrR family transcriptional regulator [Spirochaetia bacterium]|nr:TetR/AcrR family transcriptional regulator [Spirochaetia bacterium]
MPAIFTDERKKKIIRLLIENGIELFGMYGVKKTTVDELAAKSSIAKGSFYKFFPSKENLLIYCFKLIRERISEELTDSILQNSGSPEESIQQLLQTASNLPALFPVIKEFYNFDVQNLLLQIAEELNIEKKEFTPSIDFEKVQTHWRVRGFTIDADPQDLGMAAEVLTSHTAVFGTEEFKKGIDLLIEFSSIGSTGFISSSLSP